MLEFQVQIFEKEDWRFMMEIQSKGNCVSWLALGLPNNTVQIYSIKTIYAFYKVNKSLLLLQIKESKCYDVIGTRFLVKSDFDI